MSKEEKKHLCGILDCQKLSAEARAHAVKNERLPLRTVVQVLFFEHEKQGSKSTGSQDIHQSAILTQGKGTTKATVARQTSGQSSTSQRLEPGPKHKSKGKNVAETRSDRTREIMEEEDEEETKQELVKVRMQRSKSEHVRHKGK